MLTNVLKLRFGLVQGQVLVLGSGLGYGLGYGLGSGLGSGPVYGPVQELNYD